VNWVDGSWREHGTKLLGSLTVVLGAMQALTLWFTPRGLQLVGCAAAIVGGLTVRRGFQNSANQDK
jgi:hypothetical protein